MDLRLQTFQPSAFGQKNTFRDHLGHSGSLLLNAVKLFFDYHDRFSKNEKVDRAGSFKMVVIDQG